MNERSSPGAGPHPNGVSREARDAALASEGWVRRFVASPPRLRESRDLYESMGLEVHLDPITEAELREECAGCALALGFFRVIYTREVR